jgi:predicted Zn-dependent protease
MRTLFLAVGLLVSCSGCFGPAPAAEFVQQAERLHDGALASTVTRDSDLGEYFQLVGQRLLDAARQQVPGKVQNEFFSRLRFHLVNVDVPNAYATGGSHLYFYAGLFQRCRTEEELAAAMAHALAHAINLDLEHTNMRPDPRMPLDRVAWQFVVNRFTLAQERAADRLAFEIYAAGGWDARRFPTLFDHLKDEFPDRQAADREPLSVRAGNARSWLADASRGRRRLPVADPRTFASLRRQAASMGRAAGTADAQLFLRAFPNCILSGDLPEQVEAQQRLRPPPPPPTRLEPS